VAKVVPKQMWGGDDNQHAIMHYIDHFVSVRKFETLTLHEVTQKLSVCTIKILAHSSTETWQIAGVSWLQLPGQDGTAKLARSDFIKRKEIFQEFVYWIFDSFLIPLIRSNFYVTESSAHRNRMFYFRHDVWRMLTEPSLSTLKLDMFEEMPNDRTNRLLAARPLGFSKLRLLPKKQGIRMIMNLKRRPQVTRYGAVTLGRSINSVMTPIFNAVTYEKVSSRHETFKFRWLWQNIQPEKLASSLFSVGDMLPKLDAFKESLRTQGLQDRQLYFAKVDVVSCFDTIPQKRLLALTDGLMSTQTYQTGKHVEIRLLGALQRLDGEHVNPAPRMHWTSHTAAGKDALSFGQLVQDKLAGTKSKTIFVNSHLHKQEAKADLMHLLREHVERNIVKMGKSFFRQKTGIPQGSILSSILCNYFYAELERDVLAFAQGSDCLLLRLLDDFLLITVDRQHAERFVRVMHRGHADYGVQVKPTKSMTNFDVVTDDGVRVPKCSPGTHFLYCGICIDTTTLEVRKNTERSTRAGEWTKWLEEAGLGSWRAADVENSLTIELSKVPGQSFHRKALK
jgi:telomerase reverse transcriptase